MGNGAALVCACKDMMHEHRRHTMAEPKPIQSAVTVKEATSRHADHWILMRVTEFTERGQPAAGQIMAVSRSDRGVWNRFVKLHTAAEQQAGASYYIFQAFPRSSGPGALQQALKTAQREGPPHGWRW